MPVREVFTTEIVTVGPDQDLSDALQIMAANQVRRLPVVDEENRLVGVVSQADVALEAGEVGWRDGRGDLEAAGRPAWRLIGL